VTPLARLLIIEDHPLVAQGMRALLAAHYEVAGIVDDPRRARAAVERTRPDLVLLDLSLPHRSGLELIPEIRQAHPPVKVLAVTMHVSRAMADMALNAGADGFVPKEATPTELRHAIAVVLEGERYVSERVPRRPFRGRDRRGKPSVDRLTPRQQQILRLIGEGRAGPEIARSLGVTTKTVEFHRAGIRRALGLDSELALVRFATIAGLGSQPVPEPPRDP
jgi:two-component system nitrate/nitrite response regulator NarL